MSFQSRVGARAAYVQVALAKPNRGSGHGWNLLQPERGHHIPSTRTLWRACDVGHVPHLSPGRSSRRQRTIGRGAHVASSKDRQRKLARARIERQMARRPPRRGEAPDPGRRRRELGSLVWSWSARLAGRRLRLAEAPTAAAGGCAWTPRTPPEHRIKDIGIRPRRTCPNTGTRTMTIKTGRARDRGQAGPGQRAVHRVELQVPRRQEVLRQDEVPRDHHPGALQCGDPRHRPGRPGLRFRDANLPTSRRRRAARRARRPRRPPLPGRDPRDGQLRRTPTAASSSSSTRTPAVPPRSTRSRQGHGRPRRAPKIGARRQRR